MNWGEFIHFWSGAAGVSLKPLATTAFGWTTDFETQFNQARIDFPFAYGTGVSYVYKDCNYGGYVTALNPGDYTLTQLQNLGVLNDDVSSIKVSSGYEVQAFRDDNFSGSSISITADNACLVDEDWNDKISSLKVRATSLARTAQTNVIVDGNKLIIYPNPVINELRFNSTLSMAGAIVRILDISGREVISTRPTTGSIDVSKLSTGVYTLLFIKDGKTLTQRFVK